LFFESGDGAVMNAAAMVEEVEATLNIVTLDDIRTRRALDRSPANYEGLTIPTAAGIDVRDD
jgi:hypothetical protein